MKYLGKPFKQDQNGLFFVDSSDISTEEFHFMEIEKAYAERRKFYKIDGVEDYVIKDTTKLPYFFNQTRTKLILKRFMNKQDNFSDIDFPVGYYLDNDKIKGTVVPLYKDAISIRKLITILSFEELKNYYLHDDNDVRNLVYLSLEILNIIEELYQENIVYTDINAGNFLVYNNSVKIIDFEPDYVHFTKNKDKYYKLLLSNYNVLINYIWKRYKFKNMIYNLGETFDDARNRVKSLVKEKRN